MNTGITRYADEQHVADASPACASAVTGCRVAVRVDGPAGAHALRWATAEARRRGGELLVQPDGGPAVPSDVTLLVVPAALPELADVIATARCPLVVVPEPDHDAPDGTGERVVLLVGPAPGRPTVEAAFRAAARRGARLLAVRVCHQPSVELGGWLPPTRLAQWDAVAEQLRRELDSALSRCRMDFPRLAVTAMVVDDDPLQFLEALSHRAALIVLGHPTNGRARSTDFSTSVLARHARCPVMVVPVGA